MWEEKFLIEYNSLVAKMKKAEAFFNADFYKDKQGNEIKYTSLEQEIKMKDKFIPMYQEVIKRMSLMQQQYLKRFGVEISEDEKINGFKC